VPRVSRRSAPTDVATRPRRVRATIRLHPSCDLPARAPSRQNSGTLINYGRVVLIVKAAVKEALEDKNVASDFYDALDDEVTELLEDAARRAEANDRKTVQPRDL